MILFLFLIGCLNSNLNAKNKMNNGDEDKPQRTSSVTEDNFDEKITEAAKEGNRERILEEGKRFPDSTIEYSSDIDDPQVLEDLIETDSIDVEKKLVVDSITNQYKGVCKCLFKKHPSIDFDELDITRDDFDKDFALYDPELKEMLGDNSSVFENNTQNIIYPERSPSPEEIYEVHIDDKALKKCEQFSDREKEAINKFANKLAKGDIGSDNKPFHTSGKSSSRTHGGKASAHEYYLGMGDDLNGRVYYKKKGTICTIVDIDLNKGDKVKKSIINKMNKSVKNSKQ